MSAEGLTTAWTCGGCEEGECSSMLAEFDFEGLLTTWMNFKNAILDKSLSILDVEKS